ETTVQPFVGAIWNFGPLYVHGFSAVDVPTDTRDVTILYNDIGVGYWLFRDAREGVLVNAVVPPGECHFNTPPNHRGGLNLADPAGTPDVVDLTLGVHFQIFQRGTASLAFVAPLTGPKPFDYELMAQVNWCFGPGAR